MEQRLTLISDPTEEFPDNTNSRFKVRIPDGLRLEGKGWQVALLSLTLPNSDTTALPFVSGPNNMVIRTRWSVAHFNDNKNGQYTTLLRRDGEAGIDATHVAGATSGVSYWNKVVQAHEVEVVKQSAHLRLSLITPIRDPAPCLFVKKNPLSFLSLGWGRSHH